MGYLTLGVLALTVIALGFGALFGMLRGRNRALLRLVLIVVCVALAVLLRGVVTKILMELDLGGETIKDILTEALTEGGTALPQSMQNLVFTLVEVLIGLIAFFLLFFLFRFITWILIYPICKIFIKKGANKRKGFGALIGLVQGVVIATAVWGPATGMITQVNKLSKVEMQGERLIEVPEELDMDGYVNSPFAKVYNALGGWLFDILSSGEMEDGTSVSIEDTCDVVEAVAGISEMVSELQSSIKDLNNQEATAEEQMQAMHELGDMLIELDEIIDALSSDAKTLINDLLVDAKELLRDEETGEIPPEYEEIFSDLNIDNLNLDVLGRAINGIANYIEKTSDDYVGEGVLQAEVNDIVNGLASSSVILGFADSADDFTLPIEDEHKSMFAAAVESTTLSSEDKASLRKLLGLN